MTSSLNALDAVTRIATIHAQLDVIRPTGFIRSPPPLNIIMKNLGAPDSNWDIFKARQWIKAHDVPETINVHDDPFLYTSLPFSKGIAQFVNAAIQSPGIESTVRFDEYTVTGVYDDINSALCLADNHHPLAFWIALTETCQDFDISIIASDVDPVTTTHVCASLDYRIYDSSTLVWIPRTSFAEIS